MIGQKIVYEALDLRKDPPVQLSPLAILRRFPGVIEVNGASGSGFQVEMPDEDADVSNVIEEDLELQQITIHTKLGRVILTPLTLDSYERNVRPFTGGPEFTDQDEMQRFWYTDILNA